MTRIRREAWAALLGFCALAFLFHSQWVMRMLKPAAAANIDLSDVFYTAWTVDWTTTALLHPGRSLFDAPIFAPHLTTLAYSEHFLGLALMMLPVTLLTGDSLFSVQAALALSTALMGWMTFLLIRALGGSATGAYIGGIIAAFAPTRLLHVPSHMHILMLWGIPFCLLCLHRAYETKTIKWFVLLGAGIVVQGLFSLHGLLFLLIALVCAGIVYGAESEMRWRWWFPLVGTVVGALLFLVPILAPYVRLSHDLNFARPAWEHELFAAGLRDFLTPPAFVPVLAVERHVGPGLTPLAWCAVVAGMAWGAARKRRAAGLAQPIPSRVIISYVLIGLMGVLFALGPDMRWVRGDGPFLPGVWRLVGDMPAFSGIRAIGRFAQLTVISIAVIIGLLWDRAFIVRSPRWKAYTAMVAVAFMLAEFFVTAPPTQAVDPALRVPRPVDQWLAALPQGCVVAEVPFDDVRTPSNESARFMYLSRYHKKSLVNGYSGTAPPGYFRLEGDLYRGDLAAGIEGLYARGTDYVVIHPRLFDTRRSQTIVDDLVAREELEFVTRFPDDVVFRFKKKSIPSLCP